MANSYYECHITMEGDPKQLEYETSMLGGWSFSKIDGDIVLGKGVKCYATKHMNMRKNQVLVIAEVRTAAHRLRKAGVNVTREKVEVVVYDTRAASIRPDDYVRTSEEQPAS